MKEDLEQLLIDLEEYMEERADADWNYEAQIAIPNEAMRLLSRIQQAQKQLNESEED